MRQWDGIVIHHSNTGDCSAAAVDRYHREVKGWKGIGYHFVVRRDGAVELGRSLEEVGAHARNPFPSRNRTHIGILLPGKNWFRRKQVKGLKSLLRVLCTIYNIAPHKIERHHHQCPGPGLDVLEVGLASVARPLC